MNVDFKVNQLAKHFEELKEVYGFPASITSEEARNMDKIRLRQE